MNYNFLNKILLKNITKYFPKTLNRKIFRRYRIFFVPTNLKNIPKSFYPISTNIKLQENLIYKYNLKKKLINATTKSNLDMFLSNLYKKTFFSFLDIGGDNIDLYMHLNRKLNITHFFIYNFLPIISIFKKIKSKFIFNNFFPLRNINSIKSIDFVYFGSCIQYFKDYKPFLFSIFKKKPRYIFFAGTSFFYKKINNEAVIVKQTNILPNTIFLFFFNYNNFINYFYNNGYKLVYKQKNKTAKINYKNFTQMYGKIEYLDLMFEKIK
jgi:hypothetical protein